MEFAVAGGHVVCVAGNGADARGAMECGGEHYNQRPGTSDLLPLVLYTNPTTGVVSFSIIPMRLATWTFRNWRQIPVTNYLTVTQIHTNPHLRQIVSQAVWTFQLSGKLFTNTIVTLRAPTNSNETFQNHSKRRRGIHLWVHSGGNDGHGLRSFCISSPHMDRHSTFRDAHLYDGGDQAGGHCRRAPGAECNPGQVREAKSVYSELFLSQQSSFQLIGGATNGCSRATR